MKGVFMKIYSPRKIYFVMMFFTLIGCASLPPEAVISQKKISEGIETARKNQILLINNFAEEAKSKIQLSFQLAIPGSLKNEYGEKESYSQQEIHASLVDYGKQLQADLKQIDDKRNDLIQETNNFFYQLTILSNANLELLESSVALNEKYRTIFDGIVSKNDNLKQILERE
jgi:hypothetical protein